MAMTVRWPIYYCLILGLSPVVAAADDADPFENDLPMVLTPARLRQSLADVPASVTVITAEMMERFGITSVPEALRLVPGMAVTQVTGNDYRINYHGTNILVPRRMNVLIDGMSIYRPALARVDWTELPVAIDDIEKIEVTRGPNSVTYGANAMLAIVNIITKHPRDVGRAALALRGGTQNTKQGTARFAGRLGDATAYRITLNHNENSGFDYASTFGQGHDGLRLSTLNFRSVTELSRQETLDFQASATTGVKQVEFVDRFQQAFPDRDAQNYYFNGRWQKTLSPQHELQIQAYATRYRNDQEWVSCPPTATLLPELFTLWRANPAYANAVLAGRIPSGGSPRDDALARAAFAAIRSLGPRAGLPMCSRVDQNLVESRYDAELQDTFVFSSAIRMVSGIGVRRDVGDSRTFLNGRVVNNSWRAFSNVEYKPAEALNLNVGGFFERDQLAGGTFSPRLALNAHLTKFQTIRFVASKGVRMPDILEQRANWTYPATIDPPINGSAEGRFYISALAPGGVRPEKVISREFGYLANFPQRGLVLEAKLFDDRLSDLISEKLQVSDFSPTNRNSARLRGSELQLTYEPSNRWMLYLAYAYLDNDASTALEQTQYAKHSGVLGVSHAFDNQWRATFAYYGYAASGAGQSFYGRKDLTLAKTFRLGQDSNFTTALTLRHLDNLSSRYFVDFGQSREGRYDDALQYLLTLRLTF